MKKQEIPLDYKLNSELSKTYKNGLATGENLFSMQDSRNLILYGGMRKDIDWLQFDCSLSYGLVEYLKTLKMMKENNWSSHKSNTSWRTSNFLQYCSRIKFRWK